MKQHTNATEHNTSPKKRRFPAVKQQQKCYIVKILCTRTCFPVLIELMSKSRIRTVPYKILDSYVRLWDMVEIYIKFTCRWGVELYKKDCVLFPLVPLNRYMCVCFVVESWCFVNNTIHHVTGLGNERQMWNHRYAQMFTNIKL